MDAFVRVVRRCAVLILPLPLLVGTLPGAARAAAGLCRDTPNPAGCVAVTRQVYAKWAELVATGGLPQVACATWACDLRASVATSLAAGEPGFSCLLDVTCDLTPALLHSYDLNGAGLPADASAEDLAGVTLVFDAVRDVVTTPAAPAPGSGLADPVGDLTLPGVSDEDAATLVLYLVGVPETPLPTGLDSSRALSPGTAWVGFADGEADSGSGVGSIAGDYSVTVHQLVAPKGCELAISFDMPWLSWTKRSFSLTLRYTYGQRLIAVSIYDTTDPQSSRYRCPGTTVDLDLAIERARYEPLPLGFAAQEMATNSAHFVVDATQSSPYVNSYYTASSGQDVRVVKTWERGLFGCCDPVPVIWGPGDYFIEFRHSWDVTNYRSAGNDDPDDGYLGMSYNQECHWAAYGPNWAPATCHGDG